MVGNELQRVEVREGVGIGGGRDRSTANQAIEVRIRRLNRDPEATHSGEKLDVAQTLYIPAMKVAVDDLQ